MKRKVLFICIHNSARSQIAEELLRKLSTGDIETESAGITPGELNPLAVEVLLEEGIDIRGKEPRDLSAVLRSGKMFTHVITVCDESSAERCPVFPGAVRRIHWNLPDPSALEGSWDERLE